MHQRLTNVTVLDAQSAITAGEVDAVFAAWGHDEGVSLADEGAAIEVVGVGADEELEGAAGRSCCGEHARDKGGECESGLHFD